jgi:hypothetical protein
VEKFLNEKPVEKKQEAPKEESKSLAGPAPRPRRKKAAAPTQTA